LKLRLHASLSATQLAGLATRQANHFFPDERPLKTDDVQPAVHGALARIEHCFSHIANKYFFDGEAVVFDHLHGDQYAMWLYVLSNELHRTGGDAGACKKLFLLNKSLHGCDLFYEVELPSVFLLVHPLGTVLGRGRFEYYLLVYQRCGVGANHDIYPTLGRHVTMRPGSAVLGRSTIGENCTIATESLLLDDDLTANSVYIGNPRDYVVRPKQDKEAIWRT
jgi:serine O-acetyltransferase